MHGTTRVFDVGGGLAGISAALRLAERGCRVALLDGSDRLGGKAGCATSVSIIGTYSVSGPHAARDSDSPARSPWGEPR